MNDSQSATPGSDLSPQTDEVESADAEEAGEGLSAKIPRFVRTCWVKRRMVFGIVAAGILVSVLYARFQPAVYTSTTTLMPPSDTSPYAGIMNMLSPNSAGADLGSEMFGLETRGDLFIAIMKSRNVQDALINRLGLANYYKARSIEDARRSLAGATTDRARSKEWSYNDQRYNRERCTCFKYGTGVCRRA